MGSNIGTGEILVILIVGLLVVGPEKLPKLARAFGKAIAGFKSYMNDVTTDLKDATDLTDLTGSLTEMQKDLQDTLSGATNDVRDAVKLKGNGTEKTAKSGKKPVKKAVVEPAQITEKTEVTEEAEVTQEAEVPEKTEIPEETEVKNKTAQADTQKENIPAGDPDAIKPLAEQL